MRCLTCGADLPPQAEFCGSCGGSVQSSAPLVPMEERHVVHHHVIEAAPLVHAPPRDVGTGYLLWLPGLLGVCGIHRFYTGRWFTGLIWFMTIGLCGLGQFIDLFLIPGQCDRPK